MNQVPNWDPFSQKEKDKVDFELSETENEQNNCEHDNGRDQCHNSDNLAGQV